MKLPQQPEPIITGRNIFKNIRGYHIIYAVLFFGLGIHLNAQNIFSDNSSIKNIGKGTYFFWQDRAIKDTIMIGKEDTILAVHDFPAGGFFINFRVIGLFVYFEIVVTDSLMPRYQIPHVVRQGNGKEQLISLHQKRTGGGLTGWSYSEKNGFSQLAYSLISDYCFSKELYIIIREENKLNSASSCIE